MGSSCKSCIYGKMEKFDGFIPNELPSSPLNLRTFTNMSVLNSLKEKHKNEEVMMCTSKDNSDLNFMTGELIHYPAIVFNKHIECRFWDDGLIYTVTIPEGFEGVTITKESISQPEFTQLLIGNKLVVGTYTSEETTVDAYLMKSSTAFKLVNEDEDLITEVVIDGPKEKEETASNEDSGISESGDSTSEPSSDPDSGTGE